LLQSSKASAHEILRRPIVAGETLEVGRGELNKGLEKISRFGLVSGRIPERFENLMAFPPIRVVVEVYAVEVVIRSEPLFERE
jgi:hypothetical protein